jgi:hypothetical protein
MLFINTRSEIKIYGHYGTWTAYIDYITYDFNKHQSFHFTPPRPPAAQRDRVRQHLLW